ncbi:MAG: 16S rRNA (guanine(966)-N(2))-methyltransferase RsmD [Vicinamibacterales bacterium]
MRVIGGRLRGRRLASPSWSGLRPTSDRLRESVFNVLGDRVLEATVADVCAGTGAVGIEALSRGARQATFVESDPRAVALIRENLRACGLDARAAVVRADAAQWSAGANRAWDLVFADPPYDRPEANGLLRGLGQRVSEGGWVLFEHAWRDEPPEAEGLTRFRTLRAGDSAVSFYRPSVGVGDEPERAVGPEVPEAADPDREPQ